MGRILVSEFISLDGVFESPSWTMAFGFDPAMGADMSGLMGEGTSDILLGRTTHAEFAPAWSTRTADDDPGAPFMNDTPKHVVTSRPLEVEWSNSTVLGGYDPEAIARLRDEAAGNVWVTGSGTLVRALLTDTLVDELHLFLYPVIRGTGKRLFLDGEATRTLALAGSHSYDNGVLHLHYAPTG